mmetsp:Transcript_2940/g.10959  ORF Transcript_2940/g.10959 Transcript_2940/m.10959 type:complete len:233 (-) Transcript_2940:26-724(-)
MLLSVVVRCDAAADHAHPGASVGGELVDADHLPIDARPDGFVGYADEFSNRRRRIRRLPARPPFGGQERGIAARADARRGADDAVALDVELPTLARRRARRSRRWPLGPDGRRMDRSIGGSADLGMNDGARGALDVRGLVVLRRGRGSRAHLGNGRGKRSALELHPAPNRSSPALSDHRRTHPKRGGGGEFRRDPPYYVRPVRDARADPSRARASRISRETFSVTPVRSEPA